MRLPEANAETKAWFIVWLEGFSSHVQAVDEASARPLFRPDILAFGTHRDALRSLEAWVETQWARTTEQVSEKPGPRTRIG